MSSTQFQNTFLDDKTLRIDALITKKKRLIKLLKEKRSALISHAVTKGLNPNTPIKESGSKWLGNIPAHWKSGRLRRWWEVIDCKHRTVPFVDDGIPLASISEVQGISIDLSNAKKTTREEFVELIDGNRLPKQGDIIYSRNATVGEAAFVDVEDEFAMGQDVCLIRSDHQHQKYLVYLLRSEVVLRQLESQMIGATFKRINVADIKAFHVCVPPIDEQQAICQFADNVFEQYKKLLKRTYTAIERLREYRSALIFATITGKIDVRSYVGDYGVDA